MRANLGASLLSGMTLIGCALGVVAAAKSAQAQTGLDLASLSKLPMEELHLKSESKAPTARDPAAKPTEKGRVLRGLIVAENLDSVDFMEFRRPPGRPMSMIMYWRYPQDKIDQIIRLPDAERQQLAQRIDDFKNRKQAEADGLPKLDLQRVGDRDGATWHYENLALLATDSDAATKLIVDSTAEEETTRLSISRIEQIFTAYREILPPRRTRPAAPLQIKLFGAMQPYQAYLGQLGLAVENPAVFVPPRNLLVAGSELSAYADQLKDVRERHKALRKEYKDLADQMPEHLVQFRKDLAAAGYTKEDQTRLARAAEGRWERQLKEFDLQIHSADRKNAEEYYRVTERMFVRLFHEAFHAYLENYVYPQSDHDIPRWLNEGLAQVFEGGQLESGSLRLDAPDAVRLKKLQQNLRDPQSLSLAELLSADGSRFLVLHPGGAGASQRHYLYSWGLAYYMAFRQPLLETPALDRYVEQSAAKRPPIERFEKLVGMPLGEFEAKWRTEMLKMKSSGR